MGPTTLLQDIRLPHIHILPPELVLDIFTICTDHEGLAPLKLRQVCRRWRDITDTSPLLWSTLALDNDMGMGSILTAREAEVWSRNAQPLKYDIHLNVTAHEYVLPMLSPLLPYVDRWRYFAFSDRPEEAIEVQQYDLHPDKLIHLFVNLYDYDDDSWEDEPRISFCEMEGTSEYALNITLAYLPSSYLLSRLRFVHITLIEGGPNGINTSSSDILQFLASSPELESFFLAGFPHDEPEPMRSPLVRLPNLITLHLKSTCFVRILLCNLDAPRLANLVLTQLNISYPLLPSSAGSEGESDDEAKDFSLSPSSDKATGMGLRKLLKRSSPPLRMLNMDFSDMRTKDFQYVFDRLPCLEDFVIVGSDMSDKVVNLLRPVSAPNTDAPLYVRLPHLRKLGLVNCLRMTGNAIVRAIRDRVTWTDLHTPSWTLVEVDVTNCSGVDTTHRSELQRFLGNRYNEGS
ncbi:hypothetical protein D9619_007239 [Psilocybe cf. subviscida]|uniref:F-box domain-containing protein n=1 Tax=Psilocybe cf. subviscida TaxID=2480587 RepID=A0A8H5B324_9AGAR|nr:hypothetical protein D9619_007239 [Psilocybe cf. subviscida]